MAQTNSTFCIVRPRSRSGWDFEFFSRFTTIQTVNSYISALAHVRKLCLSMYVHGIIK